MAAADRKLAEGLEYLTLGDKHMKTGIFKWKPDCDSAVSEYNKAALAFKNGKHLEKAATTYIKSAQVQQQMGSHFHAAKNLENAAMIYKDLNKHDKAADLVDQASNLYVEHSTPDTACISLDRAAKMIAPFNPERATVLLVKAVDIAEAQDNIRLCSELIGKAGRLYIRNKKLDLAAGALKREIEYNSQVENHAMNNKLVFGLVLVHLHRGDYVDADKAFQNACGFPQFADSEEAEAIENMLKAYDEQDQKAFTEIARGPLFKFMENDFTKLARDLVVPGGGNKSTGNPLEEGGNANDEEFDLC